MLLVGLTGGLGAGKSTVARMLRERGAVLVDADELARRVLEPGTSGYKQVCDLFGDEVLTQFGDAEREAVADVVIRNNSTLAYLERQVDELWEQLRARVD